MSGHGTVATLPLAPGTPSNCHTYYNYYTSPHNPAVIDASQAHLWSPPPSSCDAIAKIIAVDVEEFVRLNPSLNLGNCVVEPGLSYCGEETRSEATTGEGTCEYLHEGST